MRIEEKQRELVPRDVYESMIDQMAGLDEAAAACAGATTSGSGAGLKPCFASCAARLANGCLQMAAKCGEPPLSEQD